MRILEILQTNQVINNQVMVQLVLKFEHQGIRTQLLLALPGNWYNLTRAQKLAWAKQQVADHLVGNVYLESHTVIYPDKTAQEQAATDFEAMPGWATWTAQEVAAWVDANVTNVATARTAIRALAQAIVYLRDRVIEK